MVTDGFPAIWRWVVWGWSYINTAAGSMVVSLLGIGLIALQLQRQDRRAASGQSEDESPERLGPAPDQPKIEILSPFDYEDVGLREKVRGRVFPPDQELQVLVYAPDRKWYPQKPVDVKGEFWSVWCQFGQLEDKGGDTFRITAVLGSKLNDKMWYSDLPDGVRANVVQVRKQEYIVEQRLTTALNDLRNAQLTAKQEKGTKDEIYKLYRDEERKVAELTWLASLAAEQAKNIADYVVVTIATYPHAGELVLEGKELCITLGLYIRNESVFDISILPKDVSGSMSVDGKSLKEPVSILIGELRGPIENLKPRKTEMLVLEQPLRQSEAERITRSLTDAGAKIWIGSLSILASSDNSHLKVEPKQLHLTDRNGHIQLRDFKCNTRSLDDKD